MHPLEQLKKLRSSYETSSSRKKFVHLSTSTKIDWTRLLKQIFPRSWPHFVRLMDFVANWNDFYSTDARCVLENSQQILKQSGAEKSFRVSKYRKFIMVTWEASGTRNERTHETRVFLMTRFNRKIVENILSVAQWDESFSKVYSRRFPRPKNPQVGY